LRGADFSVFFRRRNRVSEVGFPTKYAEATTCGIPVITNSSSDLAEYLRDGVNGILVEEATARAIESALRRAATMGRLEVEGMKEAMRSDKAFCIDAWQERMAAFMSRVRLAP